MQCALLCVGWIISFQCLLLLWWLLSLAAALKIHIQREGNDSSIRIPPATRTVVCCVVRTVDVRHCVYSVRHLLNAIYLCGGRSLLSTAGVYCRVHFKTKTLHHITRLVR